MTAPSFASSADAKKKGWFSRRHQTADAHRAAQDRWRVKREDQAMLVKEQQARTLEKREAGRGR